MATVALIEPQAPRLHVFSFAALPRLGLPSLGAILKGLGHQVTIYCQGLSRLPMAEILKADLVGISTTTSTAPEAYRIADTCRSRGIPVLIGGVHATFQPEEALQHADCCVTGEAEHVIAEAVDRLLDRGPARQPFSGGCFVDTLGRAADGCGPERVVLGRQRRSSPGVRQVNSGRVGHR